MKRRNVILLLFSLYLITSLISIIGIIYSKIRYDVDKSFLLKGNEKVIVSYGKSYFDPGFSFNDSLMDKSSISVLNNVNTHKVGTYEVKYTLRYKNYSKSLTRKVEVIDEEAPIINIDCEDEEFLELNKDFKGCKYTVSDNSDKNNKISVTMSSNLDNTKVGDYTITWTAKDSNNNTSKKQITVHVRKKDDLNYIDISISKQRLDYYENGKLYLTTPITSGKYDRTPKGNFRVFNKSKNTVLKSGNYVVHVKYWIGFKGYKYGIHDASWRSKFGTKDYYTKGSHGCVNTPDEAIEKLFKRVKVGMPIHIRN